MTEIPRMRTINEAYALLLEQDPETRITRHAFRVMVVQGKIPAFKVGNRFLVNVDRMGVNLEKEFKVNIENEHPED